MPGPLGKGRENGVVWDRFPKESLYDKRRDILARYENGRIRPLIGQHFAHYLGRMGRQNLRTTRSKSRGGTGLSIYSAAPALSAFVFS
jgi:hypothetical protein